jgi:hypothetical protein
MKRENVIRGVVAPFYLRTTERPMVQFGVFNLQCYDLLFAL